jgi:hypothetical protein
MLQLILLLSLLLSGLACQGGGRPDGTAARTPGREVAVPPDTVITLQRTICYGMCPAYKLTIRGDGTLIYEGKEFVKTTGTVKSSVTREQLKELLSEFEKADYFSLRDSYQTMSDGCPTYWTDNPSANTSIQLGGRRKAIAHYYGCQEEEGYKVYPQKLYVLESRIDEIVNSARWVKGGDRGAAPLR